MKIQDSQIVKTILRKKNNTGVIMLPDFKSYHKAMTIKTDWHQDRHYSTMESNWEARNKPTHLTVN